MSQESEQIQEPTEEPGAGSEAAEAAPEAGEQGAEEAAGQEPIGPVVADAMERIVSVLRVRGRSALESGARRARRRMDLYQARRDLDKLYQKLGREVIRLVEAGEIHHPGLVKGVERVRRQEEAVQAAAEAARQQAVDEAAEARATVPEAGSLAGSGEPG